MKILLFLVLTICCGQIGYSQQIGNNPSAGGYVKTNGINLYYEKYGKGAPLLILHGNGGSMRSHASRIQFFSNMYQVIAVDSRGHGKSIDDQSALSYDMMAADIKVLLDSLHLDSVYVWGQSDGAILALLLAINYPNKVKRIAAFAPNTVPDATALESEIVRMIEQDVAKPKTPKNAQLGKLLMEHPHISTEQLKKIKCPTLLIAGDRDAIKLEHMVYMFQSIKTSNLFVMPGATHFGANEYPELMQEVVVRFFNGPFRTWSTVDKIKGLY